MHGENTEITPKHLWQNLPDDVVKTAILPRLPNKSLRTFAWHCKTGRRLVTAYAQHLFLLNSTTASSQRRTCTAINALEKFPFSDFNHIQNLSLFLGVVITPDFHPAFKYLALCYFATSAMGVNPNYCRNVYRLHIMSHQPLDTLKHELDMPWNAAWGEELLALARECKNVTAFEFIQRKMHPQLDMTAVKSDGPTMAHG
ncbi:MAG TPA: hypothetical protein VGV92_07100 [Gammaproteobacteria bacterium]|nr:hypothetical protein [Gammaproteobacteria bacterium]